MREVTARAKSLRSSLTLCSPMDCVAHQAPLSMGFSSQECWSGLPCPPPGDLSPPGDTGHLPEPGIEPVSLASPALAGRFFTNNATWEAHICHQPPAYLSPIFLFSPGLYHLAIFLFILVLPILQEAPSSMKVFPTVLCMQKYWFLFLSWSYMLNKI